MRKRQPTRRLLDEEDGRGGVAGQRGVLLMRRGEACVREYGCTTLEYMGHPLYDKGIGKVEEV
jgi:hypothetical protein